MKERLALLSLLAIVAAGVVYQVGEVSCDRFDGERFTALHGNLVGIETSNFELSSGRTILRIDLENDQGLRVTGNLEIPTAGEAPYPVLLLLGGARTGRNTIEYLPETDRVILLALDYPYEGKRSGLSPWEFTLALPAIRRALIRTVPAAMLAVDYLLTLPEVDAGRIVLVSGSLGALVAPAVGAMDPRISGVALLFGGGDIQSLLEANIRDDFGVATRPMAWLGKVLTCPLEPTRYIGAIAPRPIFMLNGGEDIGIPEHNARLLFAAAKEPKSQQWVDTGHVLLRDERFHELVIAHLSAWLEEQGLLEPLS